MLFHMRIPEVSFSKSFRGFDVQEVSDYVQSVAFFEEEMNRQQTILMEKVQVLEQEVNRLREVETSLFRAMKLAEEAQKNWQEKVEKEAKKVMAEADKQAQALIVQAQKEVEKSKLLVENERKQMLGQIDQEVKEQTRELKRLESIQNEIAGQLANFANQTLSSIAAWSKPVEVATEPEKVAIKKPIKKETKPQTVAKKTKARVQTSTAKAKKTTPSKKEKHLDVLTIEDDGLPTLNKVLEAYAKTTGPRGKVGEIN
ncbi:DivIVA domain-containing protein [Aquirufa sp. 5-AUSEE-100C1]